MDTGSVVLSGVAANLMLCASLIGMYQVHQTVAVVLAALLLPLGCMALFAAILADLRDKARNRSDTRNGV